MVTRVLPTRMGCVFLTHTAHHQLIFFKFQPLFITNIIENGNFLFVKKKLQSKNHSIERGAGRDIFRKLTAVPLRLLDASW